MAKDFYIKEGNTLPAVQAVLKLRESGVLAEGDEVVFAYWRKGDEASERAVAAEILSVAESTVQYEWEEGDTVVPGEYLAEWRVTKAGGGSLTFPNGPEGREAYIEFGILPKVGNSTPLADLYDAVWHLLGDIDEEGREYPESSIRTGLQTMLRMGKLKGYALTATRLGITPPLTDPNDMALLLYETVLSFKAPEPDRSALRTRAVSMSQGSNRDFIRSIEENIHEIKNGTMFGAHNDFGNWLALECGLDLFQSGLVKLPAVTVPYGATVYLTCCSYDLYTG
jgi:hypothetical protein